VLKSHPTADSLVWHTVRTFKRQIVPAIELVAGPPPWTGDDLGMLVPAMTRLTSEDKLQDEQGRQGRAAKSLLAQLREEFRRGGSGAGTSGGIALHQSAVCKYILVLTWCTCPLLKIIPLKTCSVINFTTVLLARTWPRSLREYLGRFLVSL
jgi:hypothetical protein